MGCGFSTPRTAGSLRPCAGVRVIHTNGYVEDFEGPGVVTVAHVTGCLGAAADPTLNGGSSKGYVLCSAANLLQPGRGPFRPDDALQPGTVYFLLPQSVFHAESSAVDLACLMNRLTALARKGSATAAPKPSPLDALFDATSSRLYHQPSPPVDAAKAEKKEKHDHHQPAGAGRAAPWRPRLERIDESIGRSSISMRSASSRSSACSDA